MSRKQIARTVLNGQQVTFESPSGSMVRGYVYGMDDYHWAVVSPNGQTSLVHKAGAPVIRIHPECTYEDELAKDDLEPLIRPFRQWVSEHVFGQTPTVRTPSPA